MISPTSPHLSGRRRHARRRASLYASQYTTVASLAGVVVVLVAGLSTVARLARRFDWLPTFGTGYPMALNAGLAFLLLGGILLLPPRTFRRHARLVRAACLSVAAILVAIALETPLGIDLGIDGAALHPFRTLGAPGRLSNNAAAGLLCACVAFGLLTTRWIHRSRRARHLFFGLTTLSGATGALAMLGYSLSLELFHSWATMVSMSVTTAGLLIALSVGMVSRARRLLPEVRDHHSIEARVTGISAVLLLSIAVVSVAAGLSALQAASIDAKALELRADAGSAGKFVTGSIARAAALSRLAVNQAAVGPLVERLGRPAERAAAERELRALVGEAMTSDIVGIQFRDADGHALLTLGDSEIPTLVLPVAGRNQGSSLVWSDERLLQRTTVPVRTGHGAADFRADVLVALPATQALFTESDVPGESVLLCGRQDGRIACLPSVGHPGVQVLTEREVGANTALGHAFAGETGSGQFDAPGGHRLLAAYQPLRDTGLVVVKMIDGAAINGPLTAHLPLVVGLPLLAVLLGMLALQRRVQPLVADLVQAELEAKRERGRAVASEDRLRAIADNIPVRIGYVTRDLRVGFANQALSRLTGLPREAMIGKKWRDVFPPEFLATSQSHIARALAGEHVQFKRRLKIRGAWQEEDVTYSPDVDEQGEVRGVYGLSYDITALMEAEDALKASERHFRAVTDNLPAFVAYVDSDERYRSVNAAVRRFGFEPETFVGKTMRESMGHAIYAEFRPHVRRVLEGQHVRFEGWTTVGGQRLCHRTEYIPDRDAEGEVRGFYTMAIDVTEQKLAEEALRESEENVRLLIEGVTDYAIFMLDLEGKVATWNAGAQRIKGYREDEILGRHIARFYPPEAVENNLPARLLKQARATGRAEDEGWRVRNDGSRFWAKVNITALHDSEGRLRGFTKVTRDKTASRLADEALRASESQLKAITNHLPALVCYIDRGHVFRFNNETYTRWLRRPLSEITGRSLREVYGDEVYKKLTEPLERALRGETVKFEIEFDAFDGSTRIARGTYVPDRGDDGTVQGVHGLIRDVTMAKEAERALLLAARHDSLTGLPNRPHLMQRLREVFFQPFDPASQTAVLFLDLDHFKQINDLWGHHVGDEVLKEFARRVSRAVRPTDLVARLAGDEFVVVLSGLNTLQEAEFVARKILNAMKEPFDHAERVLTLSTSIGLAMRSEADADATHLLKRADAALYAAKEAGRSVFRTAGGRVE